MRTIKTKQELEDFTIEWLGTDYLRSEYFTIDTDTDEYLRLVFNDDDTFSVEVFDKDTHLTVNEMEFDYLSDMVDSIVEAYEMDSN